MSPIRPENLARYPADWPAISQRIRAVRAGGRCECKGECGRGHKGRCRAWNGHAHPVTGSKVVLTVAHLDHAATRARTLQAEATAGMEPLFEDGAP